MNVKRTSIFAAAAIALAAAALPMSAAAHDRWERGWRGDGYGHYKPWKHGYNRYPRQVFVPPPVYVMPYPRLVPAPVYAPPPPVYYPPVGSGFTFIWSGGW